MKLIHCLKFYTCSACAIVLLAGQASRCPGQTVLVDFGNNAAQYRGHTGAEPGSEGALLEQHPARSVGHGHASISTTRRQRSIWVGTRRSERIATTVLPATRASARRQTTWPFTDIDTVALGDMGVKEAAFDYAASPIQDDTRVRFELQELDPNKKYSITFYGSHKYSNDSQHCVFGVQRSLRTLRYSVRRPSM